MTRAPLVLALASVILMSASAALVVGVAPCGAVDASAQYKTPGVYIVSLSAFHDDVRAALSELDPSCR